MQRDSTLYTIGFATLVCVCCSILVAGAAVSLQERQEINRKVYRQKNVLLSAGVLKDGEKVTNDKVIQLFNERVKVKLVDLKTGEYVEEPDPNTYDQLKARDEPTTSIEAPANDSSIRRLPKLGQVFHVMDGEQIQSVVIPVEGYGLWGTLYGYLALAKDTNTIVGITYYDHKETPGLGGEVDNPKWKALWHERKAYDENWSPVIKVIKGVAGGVQEAPHDIDGLSGATITSNGVTHMMSFWLSENGYGAYLKKFRELGSA